MSNENDEVYLLFLEESQEHLEDIESDLLELEAQQDFPDEDLLNKVFRAVHTVKGGSGFFGLTAIQNLAHAMENILGLVRAGTLKISEKLISVLLDGADKLSSMINVPESIESIDISGVVTLLNQFAEDPEEAVKSTSSTRSDFTLIGDPNDEINIAFDEGPFLFTISREDLIVAQSSENGGEFIYLIRYDLYKDIEEKGRTPQQLIKEYLQLVHFIDSFTDYTELGGLDSFEKQSNLPFYVLCSTIMDPLIMQEYVGLESQNIVTVIDERVQIGTSPSDEEQLNEILISPDQTSAPVNTPIIVEDPAPIISEPPSREISVTPKVEPKVAVPAKKTAPSKETKSTVRIPISQLEKLMNLAGELVLIRNELLQKVPLGNLSDINDASQKVDAITSDLQEAIMGTRMQPVGTVFSKFKRIVHDLSSTMGKDISLEIEGEEVELDRSIVEAISDPLTHMVRNSIDHGIEIPDIRFQSGKPRQGTLRLTAQHKAGQVIIAIQDDGAGIDPRVIGNIAVSKGVITSEQLANMSDKDIIKLIFKPGFSTAEQVTDISGRGVGMDVVLSSFTRVGGVVDIESVVGEGTLMTIKLPLTLAIIPSLLLEVVGERFAIPQVNLVELVRIKAEKVQERIERIGTASVLRLREKLLPLIKLTELLDIPSQYKDPESGKILQDNRVNLADRRSPDLLETNEIIEFRPGRREAHQSAVNIAVVSSGVHMYGIVVDSLLDSEEIVVKPLGTHLRSCSYYAGATILGDGHVAMILDIASIHEHSLIEAIQQQVASATKDKNLNEQKEVHSLLLFQNSKEEYLALPMVLVTRIEKVPADKFLSIGNRRAIHYRGDTLVILALNDLSPVGKFDERAYYNVVVFKVGDKEYGLMVGEVDDIISFDGDIDGKTYIQPGIMGTFIYNEQLTMLVDLYNLATELLPDLITQTDISTETNSSNSNKILVVEDSNFFRHQVETLLIDQGYDVITAEDGSDGLDKIQNNPDIDIILTDIEMPIMDGLEMTRRIRDMDEFKELPIVAITSLSSDVDEQSGYQAGLNEYLIKMDKEQIIETCRRLLA